jgi:Na+-driven multidrug efflux pump
MAVLGGFQVLKAVQLAYGNMLNSRGETRWVMIEAVATNVANLGLNLALTHHVLGFGPTVGRVAAATVASLLFGMLFTIGVVHLRFKVRFPLDCHWPELWRSLKPVLRIGLPSASEPISYQLAQITINLLVISLGAAALAARTYVSSFVMVSSVLWSFALGVGTQIAISHRLGAGRLEEADAQLTRSLGYAVIGNGVAALVLAVLYRPLLGLLTKDEEIVRLAAPLFAIGVLVEMGRAVNIVAGGALKSAGDAKFSAVVGASLMWLLGVPSAYLLGGSFGLSLGLTGVWISMALDEIVRGVVNYRRWKAGHWRTTSELAPRLSTLASE